MNLTLAVPSLLWPAALVEHETRLDAPALARLLRGRIIGSPLALGPEAWLAERCGLGTRPDPALAPALAMAEGLPADGGYWLLAEPVHLQLSHDDVSLALSLNPLPATDSEALLETLNAHFASEAWTFFSGPSGRWYLRSAIAPALRTVPPRLAWRRPVRHFLPSGENSRSWHRAITELQMLLYEHAVNRHREARGELSVNSLWFWGGGQYAQAQPLTQGTLIAGPGLAADLFRACGLSPEPRPCDASAWKPKETETLIWLDSLDLAMASGDHAEWTQKLIELETEWFAPLVQQVHQGKIERLRLLAFGREQMQLTEYQKPSLWQRFSERKAPPLSALLRQAEAEDSVANSDSPQSRD